MIEPLSLKIARLESILIINKKFSKKWLKALDNHKNGCPCVRFKYLISEWNKFEFKKCPFGFREHGKDDCYTTQCFHCDFSSILNDRKPSLRHFHLTHAIKNVLGINHGNHNEGDSFFSPEL